MSQYILVTRQQQALSFICILLLDQPPYLTPWPESASELYRPSDRRLSAMLVPTLPDKGCHVISVTYPYGRILGFLLRSSSKSFVTNLTQTVLAPNPGRHGKNSARHKQSQICTYILKRPAETVALRTRTREEIRSILGQNTGGFFRCSSVSAGKHRGQYLQSPLRHFHMCCIPRYFPSLR
jgi:hypothetical protein